MEISSYLKNHNRLLGARAYFVLPEKISEDVVSETVRSMERLVGKYKIVLVVPDDEISNIADFICYADFIVKYCSIEKPAVGDICIFVSASKDLVVKAALCLRLGFESSLTIDFIESGNAVYMIKEKNYLTCREPKAYQKKIEAYERELTEFGVKFNCLPVMWEDGRVKKFNNIEGISKNRRIITANDIEETRSGDSFYIATGDIVTSIAREKAEKLNVKIICR